MNYRELRDKIEELGMHEVEDSTWNGRESYLIPGLKCVHEVGGHEGGGERAERVFHYEPTDIYVKMTGYYYSYEGTTWENLEEVFPTQKTITVYEPK